MNGTIKVRGGRTLKGSVDPVPSKNSILPALAAAVLISDTVTYHDVPDSSDVKKMLEILESLGADIDSSDFDNLKIDSTNINNYIVSGRSGGEIRTSILFVGPLLARFGKAEVPVPGGCTLGRRSIAAHIDAFQNVGVKIEYMDSYIRFTRPEVILDSYNTWQTEASVTATENLAIYAAGINSNITIIDAACEPHVVDLLEFLVRFGAEIDGIGSNKVSIKGKEDLIGAEFRPSPEHIDIGGYIVAAAITGGEIKINGIADFYAMEGILPWFEKFGVSFEVSGDDLIVRAPGKLEIDLLNSGFPMAGNDLPKLYPRPWPGFPVDMIPIMVPLACKTEGQLFISNWMYETGLDFVREINLIGGNIFVSSPQSIVVNGPVTFTGGEVVSPTIIRACKALFLCALCDDVETIIHGTDILNRAYPGIYDKYRSLGADIQELS